MHKTKFIKLLKDPTVTKLNGDLDDLESLVETYPYFQSGRILLAKEKYALDALDALHVDATGLFTFASAGSQRWPQRGNFDDDASHANTRARRARAGLAFTQTGPSSSSARVFSQA